MIYLAENLRFLRKQKAWTQSQLAEKIGVKRSVIGAYEEGRSEPRLSSLQMMARLFAVELDALIGQPLDQSEASDWRKLSQTPVRVLPITLDSHGEERISLIPQKAAAGYTQGYADPEYLEQLPNISLSLPELQGTGSLRMFQIEGDSMLPLPSGAYIIGEYVEQWPQIKSGDCYVLLTRNDGILYKRVENQLAEADQLRLHSDNPSFASYSLAGEEILEVWKARGVMHFALPAKSEWSLREAQQISLALQELQREVAALRESQKKS